MRAREIIREDKTTPNIDVRWDGNFAVKAYVDGKFAGSAEFASDDPEGRYGFYAVDVGVLPQYRRMGVATAMYDAATERFGEIIPSEHQTDDARAFWNSYGRAVIGESIDAKQVLNYVNHIHPASEKTDALDRLILSFGSYELKTVPVNSLQIDAEDDPHGRVIHVDVDYAQDITSEDIKRKPIVVDPQGHILDGNHRAWQARELGIKTIPAYVAKKTLKEGKYDSFTFTQERRKLNVPLLIQKGAIFVTHPHDEQGWETDNPEPWAFSLITLYNVLHGGWTAEAKKYLKPASYKQAERQINSSAPNLGTNQLVYDGKYNQILWSIKKLGLGDEAYLDKNTP